MKDWFNKYKFAIALFAIIVVQLGTITYMFAFEKEGFHQDDAWSYQFANGNYETGMGIATDKDGNFKNANRWVDSELVREYMEVQDGMEFHYDSVLCNMSIEKNPPLHSIFVHTVCSFFPNTFSWWYAYAVNVLAFIAIMIGLYFFSTDMMHSRKLALVTCLYYGFTTAAQNTVLLLRGYAWITAFGVICLCLHSRMYRKRFQKAVPQLISIYIVMVLGCLTHYSFMMFGFSLTILFGIYLLCRKKWRFALIYGGVMALSVATVFLLWHQAVNLLLAKEPLYGMEMPLWWEIQYCVKTWFSEVAGIPFQIPDLYIWLYLLLILFMTAAFMAAAAFVLRKETFFLAFKKKTFCRLKKNCGKLVHSDKLPLLSFAACFLTLIIVAKSCNIFTMGVHSDRYLFFLMPPLAAILIWGVYRLLKVGLRTKACLYGIFSLILALGMIENYVEAPPNYLFERGCDAPTIAERTKGANVIMIVPDKFHLVYFSPSLLETEHFYVMTAEEAVESAMVLPAPPDDKPVYLIVSKHRSFLPEDYVRDENVPEGKTPIEEVLSCGWKVSDLLQAYSQLNWVTTCTELQEEESFLGKLLVVRLR